MALGDTARLIAALELVDKFSPTARKIEGSLDRLESKTGRASSTFSRIGDRARAGLGTAAFNVQRLAVAGADLLARNVQLGVQSLDQLENVKTQTDAVLKSTRGAAGETADDIRNLAEQYESLNATIDDKVIQSGENLLLTFTNIRKDAFQPALEAALDMNQAMGGGEEGLQQTVIRLGKALQDPIKGATALRRVGVNLSQQQQDQIKKLVESNRLYDAQQLILKELATEFGGSFAKAGETATAKYAKFNDAIEDARQSLATAFLPLLGKVADKLTTFLSDPKTLDQIEGFGKGLADGFDRVIEAAGKIDFGAIGTSLKIAGQGAKAVFDAFTSLPPWVQTAVLTGWGLNKLTGGALTGIVGELGKGLLGNFTQRGASAANPVWVQSVGGGLGGPNVPGGGGGILGNILKFAGIAGLLVGGEELAHGAVNQVAAPAVKFEQTQFEKLLASGDPARIQHGLEAVDDGLGHLQSLGLLGTLLARDQIAELTRQHTLLEEAKKEAVKNGQVAQESNKTEQDILAEAKAGRLAGARTAGEQVAAIKSLEQKLIHDPHFRQHVTTPEEFLKLLRRTSEFGAKGVGTDIEQGRTTGRDPVGDAFVALARRLTPPALKSVEVQGEISRHIKALEQVQGRLLRQGNIDAARHAQHNINVLGKLIGEVDKTIPHFRELERKAEQQKAQERETAERTANHLRTMQSLERRTGDAALATSRKDFSPKVNVNVNNRTSVSVNDVVRAVNSYTYAVNTYGSKLNNIPL